PKNPAQPDVQIQEIKAASGVPVDERAVDRRPRRRALDRVGARRDIEWQSRVVLQRPGQLKAVTDLLPYRLRRRHGGMDRAVENHAAALIVVGTPVVQPDIEIVDRRAEEKLADV